MPFARFELLVGLRALWFSKLQAFIDPEEGITPSVARQELKRQHQVMENWFPDEERKRQVRGFVDDNESSGRELIVANCWFMAEKESQKMWDVFASGEGVVVKSTVGSLVKSLTMSHEKYWIGKVNYIDSSTYDGMDAYSGSQAHLRAFLKNNKFSYENELRVATMNWVCPGCLNSDGSPPNERQRAGYVSGGDRVGIYVLVNLMTLIAEVRTSPDTLHEHRKKIELLLNNAGCAAPVRPSELSILRRGDGECQSF